MVRVWASDVPNIGCITSSSCKKLSIRGETAMFSIAFHHMEFSHSYFGVNIFNCDSFSTTQSKLSVVWGESKEGTCVWRSDLVAIVIPF
jgi:hypothetical protein